MNAESHAVRRASPVCRTFARASGGSGGLPRILWINCRLLHPLVGGDRLRTFHMLRHLKRWFHITYLCPLSPSDDDEAIDLAREYCDELAAVPHRVQDRGGPGFACSVLWNCAFGSLPFAARKYASTEVVNWLGPHLEAGRFSLVICDYLVSLVHILALERPTKVPVVVFQHNVESLIWQRHAAAARNPLKRWVYRREERLTIAMEGACARVAQGQITVSPLESRYFREERGMNNILGDVPAGVDCGYFEPTHSAEPHTIAFLGSMDWEANRIAVRAFLETTYPSVKSRFPDARFLVIGRNPSQQLRDAAAADPSVEVTGTVPDVRPFLSRAALLVLPLEVGGGTRVKVFEAMAAGVAIVSTPVGVEGLPVEPGRHAIIVPSGSQFTEAVARLLSDVETRGRIAAAARAWVEAEFSWEGAALRFKELCERCLQPR